MSRPVTVVTGGSRGIGAATCTRLAADGHDVVVGYVGDGAAAECAATAVRAARARGVTVCVDTSAEDDVGRLYDTTAERLGPVTGLANNAGVTGPLGRLADTATRAAPSGPPPRFRSAVSVRPRKSPPRSRG